MMWVVSGGCYLHLQQTLIFSSTGKSNGKWLSFGFNFANCSIVFLGFAWGLVVSRSTKPWMGPIGSLSCSRGDMITWFSKSIFGKLRSSIKFKSKEIQSKIIYIDVIKWDNSGVMVGQSCGTLEVNLLRKSLDRQNSHLTNSNLFFSLFLSFSVSRKSL